MDAEDGTPDYTGLDAPELLDALRDDGMAWAKAFCQQAVKLGYSEMDVGWVHGWFANAIETSSDVRLLRSQPTTRGVIQDFPKPSS